MAVGNPGHSPMGASRSSPDLAIAVHSRPENCLESCPDNRIRPETHRVGIRPESRGRSHIPDSGIAGSRSNPLLDRSMKKIPYANAPYCPVCTMPS